MRPNTKATLISSSTREQGTVVKKLTAGNARGVIFTVHAEATTGDGTQDLQIALKTPHEESGQDITLLSDSFSDGATGLRQYLVYPGVSDTQGVYTKVQATPPPEALRIEATVTAGGDVSYTYSVTREMLLE